MIAKLLLQNTFFVVAMGAVLFASAGTLHWPGAWAFLSTSAIIGLPADCRLAKTDPGAARRTDAADSAPEQPAADKKFMLVFVVAALIWLIAIGLTGACRPPPSRSRCRHWAWRCT